MIQFFGIKTKVIYILLLACFVNTVNANPAVSMGAYYFDGWTGTYPYHVTSKLKDSFGVREPKWGWITSTQQIVDEQINTAADAGISFFCFCWYYRKGIETNKEPLNQALKFYLNSQQRPKLKFSLMVANHGSCQIGPNEWEGLVQEVVALFKEKQYQKINKKPLIVFFSVENLITKFGSMDRVKIALNYMRNKAIQAHLKGVSIIASVSNLRTLEIAKKCGFDIASGYSNYSIGFVGSKEKDAIPIDNLRNKEFKLWDTIAHQKQLPYIPVVTLNWDPRPWSMTNEVLYARSPYYVGYSEVSVYNSIVSGLKWLKSNKSFTTKEKFLMIYAWNENGEGAYLTPSMNGDQFLKGITKAIKFYSK